MNEPVSGKDFAADVLSSPDYVVFIADPGVAAEVGAEVPHGKLRDLFVRRKDEVREDCIRVVGQMQDILSSISPTAHGFVLDEMVFELGFSAEGQLAFISKAGVAATVSVTFKRVDSNPGSSR